MLEVRFTDRFLINQEYSGIYFKTWWNLYWIHIEYTLKYQNETFLINQEYSGIYCKIWWNYIEYTLKFQNETFLINQEYSGIYCKTWWNYIEYTLKFQNEMFLINQEYSGIHNKTWRNYIEYTLKFRNEMFLINQEYSGTYCKTQWNSYWIHIEYTLKFQNKTFLINYNQEYSGMIIAKHGVIHFWYLDQYQVKAISGIAASCLEISHLIDFWSCFSEFFPNIINEIYIFNRWKWLRYVDKHNMFPVSHC